MIEDYVGESFGPDSTEDFLHRNYASNVFHLWVNGRDFTKDMMSAAKVRRGLN